MIALLLLSCSARLGPPGVDPGPVYLGLGPDKPRLCVSSVPAAGPLPDRGAAWTQGLAALETQDLDAARAALVGEHPGLDAARAAVALLSGELESGRVALRDLANAWPLDACLQQAAGFAHLTMGSLDSGTGFVAAGRRLAPDQPDHVLLDGMVRAWKGDAGGAATAYRQTLSLVPGHPLASALLATDAIARGDAAIVVPLLEDALAGGLDVSAQLAPAYFAAGAVGDYVRVASASGWPLGDGGALATAADPEAAFRALLGVVDDQLHVVLETSLGTLRCELFWRQAPVAVANFVGLARGTQPWVDPRTGRPGTGALFDQTPLHRVIPDFMIQMGDPTGTGSGHPGYRFPDEFVLGLGFDQPGRMGMANNGPDRNGSQFFVTEVATPHLDGKHTIFGQCDDASLGVVRAIARVPVGAQNKPLEDVVLQAVRVGGD